jgi:hypothetical protein
MKLPALSLLFYCVSSSILLTGATTTPAPSAALVGEAAQGTDKLVYADFETRKRQSPGQ